MNLKDLLGKSAGYGINPVGALVADKFDKSHQWTPDAAALGHVFDSREGHPWLQGTARNVGHAAFGEKIGNFTDQRLLGDAGPQAPNSQSLQAQQLPMGGVQGTDSQNPMLMMIQKWMQTQGGQ
jgi:hypothetical protein